MTTPTKDTTQPDGATQSASSPSPCWAHSPLRVRLDVAANRATPALASMLARILADAGATVTFADERCDHLPTQAVKNLDGLHVHINGLTWARDEESERWVPALPNVAMSRPTKQAKQSDGSSEHCNT